MNDCSLECVEHSGVVSMTSDGLISCICVYVYVFSTDITAKEFMERRGGLRSRYELLGDFLSEMLSVSLDEINIFSLMEVRDRTLDVRFSVHSASFLRAERLHGYLAAHKQKVSRRPRRAFLVPSLITNGCGRVRLKISKVSDGRAFPLPRLAMHSAINNGRTTIYTQFAYQEPITAL